MNTRAYKIGIKGLVQGVGFRPYIYRFAVSQGWKGEVRNTTGGVDVFVECAEVDLPLIKEVMVRGAPPASQIRTVDFTEIPIKGFSGFRIAESDDLDCGITEISPDIAVCGACMADLASQAHRIDYPLVNCTHCGPRFSIVKALPYDRARTTMKGFEMCETCAREYHDIADRRFHAQPVACNRCGPVYRCKTEGREIGSIKEILHEISTLVSNGKIVALKGTGGYHLLCDALNNEAVTTLRWHKMRDQKPFAVLFRDLGTVKEYCHVTPAEEEILTSWRRPIVLLRRKVPLASGVSNGLETTGAMLPYMPVHHLLFRELKTPAVVFTSGNLSDNPVIIDDEMAENELGAIASAVVSYNREIYNRTDDSVVRVAAGNVNLIRRSRGYVPGPVEVGCPVEGILALGAEQKNTICIGRKQEAILSQHIGDLKGVETLDFFKETVERFSRMFRFSPERVVCDLHPDYLSSVYGEQLSEALRISLIRVQHHHAHISSCMAEHQLDEPVIGVSFDGTGLGADGHGWGGEFLIAGAADFTRYAHFEYLPMPGGDKVPEEPWRMALSCLYSYPELAGSEERIPWIRNIERGKRRLVREMMEKQIHSPLTSSVGRLFDAVAALTGVCTRASFEAEGPMRLESLVVEGVRDGYPFSAEKVISLRETLGAIIRDTGKISNALISTKFHNTLARVISSVSGHIRSENGINKVVLSGGVFQNMYLLRQSVSLLKEMDFEVYTHQLVPANDGGIALGQLYTASKMKNVCV